MNAFRRTLCACAAILALSVSSVFGFGPKGHRLVGAIAAQRLMGSNTAAKINQLLQGMTLERAALLADDIKGWDTTPPDKPNAFHLPGFALVEADLVAFHAANKDHRDFHFTDVPVEGNSKYLTGTTGRANHDVVHMIPFCFSVLSGATPENNTRKITKRVAIILLAHEIGDLQQPLHVGAQYFDNQGKPTNPDQHGGSGHPDKGGNNLLLITTLPNGDSDSEKLHSFWDGRSVDNAVDKVRKAMRAADPSLTGNISNTQIAKFLATHGPASAAIPSGAAMQNLVIDWANESLVVAREAHSRLDYFGVHIDSNGKFASGRVSPKMGTSDYGEFAGTVIQKGLPVAGARLADVLKTALP